MFTRSTFYALLFFVGTQSCATQHLPAKQQPKKTAFNRSYKNHCIKGAIGLGSALALAGVAYYSLKKSQNAHKENDGQDYVDMKETEKHKLQPAIRPSAISEDLSEIIAREEDALRVMQNNYDLLRDQNSWYGRQLKITIQRIQGHINLCKNELNENR